MKLFFTTTKVSSLKEIKIIEPFDKAKKVSTLLSRSSMWELNITALSRGDEDVMPHFCKGVNIFWVDVAYLSQVHGPVFVLKSVFLDTPQRSIWMPLGGKFLRYRSKKLIQKPGMFSA